MSANTAIKEGGNPHSFGPVDYLRVASGSDQYALWVPESERVLTTKSIDKNGIYRASDDGAYGWNSVYVNVPKPESVTGKDGDGDEVVVKPDPETGVLEEEKVPSSIEITTPPTKIIYADGEAIDFTGAVVKAYLETGGEYGVVPNGEITLNPNKAVYDESTDNGGAYASDLDTSPVSQPIATGFTAEVYGNPYYDFRWESNYPMALLHRTDLPDDTGSVRYLGIVGAEEPGAALGVQIRTVRSDGTVHNDPLVASRSYEHNGLTVYYGSFSTNSFSKSAIGNFIDVSGNSIHEGMIAWTLVYGTQITPTGSSQTITVSWPRPGDGAILETTFDIIVQQSFGGASGGGGQAGETGAGRND